MFFFRKTFEFFKIAKFFLECVSNGIISSECFPHFFGGFLAKNQKKLKVGKSRIFDEQKGHFEKKNAFILLKGIFNNVGGHKISRR